MRTLSLYLDLPDKYTNSAVLKLLDPIVETLWKDIYTDDERRNDQ